MNEVVPLTDAVYGTSGDDLWIQAYIQRDKKEPDVQEQNAETDTTRAQVDMNGGSC